MPWNKGKDRLKGGWPYHQKLWELWYMWKSYFKGPQSFLENKNAHIIHPCHITQSSVFKFNCKHFNGNSFVSYWFWSSSLNHTKEGIPPILVTLICQNTQANPFCFWFLRDQVTYKHVIIVFPHRNRNYIVYTLRIFWLHVWDKNSITKRYCTSTTE